MTPISIKSHIAGRKQLFQLLAVAHATGYPILLVGMPGIAKTNSAHDYAHAMSASVLSGGKQWQLYQRQMTESSTASDVVGRLSLKKLLVDNTYELDSPIADAEVIIIDEIDKTTSGPRQAFLSVLNEKKLMTGEKIVDCVWKIFIATCNEIPKDEVASALFDRFVIKYTVPRLSDDDMVAHLVKTAGSPDNKFYNYSLNIPNEAEIQNAMATITPSMIKVVIKHLPSYVTDRTRTRIIRLAGAVKCVYNQTPAQALITTIGILLDSSKDAASVVQKIENELFSPEMRDILKRIDMLQAIYDPENDTSVDKLTSKAKLVQSTFEVKTAIDNHFNNKRILAEQVMELNTVLEAAILSFEPDFKAIITEVKTKSKSKANLQPA